MLTQEDIDRKNPERKRTWREKFFRKPLAVGPKGPTLSENEWDFVVHSLRMIAEDNAEVIGTFADDELDTLLTETAESAWRLAERIEKEMGK
jgi:hypothetical protein